jgi:hypothetical protein
MSHSLRLAPDFLIALAKQRDLHGGAKSGIGPEPAEQQATELLSELRSTLMSYAAPSELRCTL